MGYLKEKYTKEYFLQIDKFGNPVNIGADGVEENKAGKVRWVDEIILNRIEFSKTNVLDLGCGRGAATKFAIDHGADKAIAVDFSESAMAITKGMLDHFGLRADLYCDDGLNFLKNFKKQYKNLKLDVVLMLDFIEHVPREELEKILILLKDIISKKSILVINTPVYKIDNDVVKEGLKNQARDTSDEYEITQGMHCNRYTKKTLVEFMQKLGFIAISGHFFVQNDFQINKYLIGTVFTWMKAFKAGYPIYPKIKREYFELALTTQEFRKPKNKINKLKNYFLKGFGLILPPIVKLLILKFWYFISKKSDGLHQYRPKWYRIRGGMLEGRHFYVDPYDGYWQEEVLEGQYDKFFFDFLQEYDLKDKVIFDIGAHIGYHSMCFAKLVGRRGKVYAFEPNIYNTKRMKIILNKNKDLKRRIKIYEVAISNTTGETEFNFSTEIDNGHSSGGYINGANVPYLKSDYEEIGFEKRFVKTTNIDNIMKDLKIKDIPLLIKIDIEGAENLIFEGGQKFIKKYHPTFLVEVHSIYNMLQLCQFFREMNYSIEPLNYSTDGRCFVAVIPSKE